jgi:hypothetical protein
VVVEQVGLQLRGIATGDEHARVQQFLVYARRVDAKFSQDGCVIIEQELANASSANQRQ